MKKMICSVCSYTYDEAVGIPEAGIAPGTKWEDLPSDWKCPWCGAGKDAFYEKQDETVIDVKEQIEKPHVEKELFAMEMSIICSNLARGCEKQYLPEQEKAFSQLAEFFRANAEPVSDVSFERIADLIEKDLSVGFPHANAEASENSDRGALRSLVWSEKVTRMLQSLLKRYETEGEKMLQNTGVYVCTICGFVFVGDAPPDLCPVCKVQSQKFEKVERRV
jgi:rubredoxin